MLGKGTTLGRGRWRFARQSLGSGVNARRLV
jgi:hypothetical protein